MKSTEFISRQELKARFYMLLINPFSLMRRSNKEKQMIMQRFKTLGLTDFINVKERETKGNILTFFHRQCYQLVSYLSSDCMTKQLFVLDFRNISCLFHVTEM